MSLAIRSNPFSERSSRVPASFPAPCTGPARTAGRAAQGGWDARSAVGRAGKYTEPVLAARWTAVAHRGRNPTGARMATSTITRAHSKGHQFVTETTRTETKERTIHAGRRTDHETRRPNQGIACQQRDRAQNPVNTTRTCNKLPDVYM